MAQSRQLAAIMFTDIVGYTTLMGEDEQKAFELLKKNRNVQRPIIEKFNGRWLKEIGDGVLASFDSVVDAVNCAATIQRTCENEPDLKLRIGIHLGDVIFEGNDVFGEGVNIASRLEPLAPIGGILVSESVNRNLGNKTNIVSTFVREEQLKNVKEPLKTYAITITDATPYVMDVKAIVVGQRTTNKRNPKYIILTVGAIILLSLAYLRYSSWQSPDINEPIFSIADKSIVVLPFSDMSPDNDQEFFSDGMMEEILNHLAKIEDIKVISRTTAMRYRGTSKSVSEIAKELGVATALEGSVRKDGDQLRITLQLIEGASDTHLWSQSYDRQMTSIFEIQSDVAKRVAEVLHTELSPEARLKIESKPTSSTKAYNLYLLGRYFWYQRTRQGLEKSLDYFEQSIAIDPEYALAHAGLADGYLILVAYGHMPQDIGFPLAKEYAQKAMEINPNLAQAYATLGTIAKREWRWQDARRLLSKSIALDPNYVMARHWYAEYLFVMGPNDILIEQIQDGLRIDPLSFLMQSQLANFYYDMGDLEKALSEYQRVLELDPMDLRHSYQGMFKIFLEMGNSEEAFNCIKTSHEVHNYAWDQSYEKAYQEQGMNGFLHKWLENSLMNPNFPPHIAELYIILREKQLALDWIEKSYESNITYLPDRLTGRFYQDLRSEPRFIAILEKMGLDPNN